MSRIACSRTRAPSAFRRNVASIQFERGIGPPPMPPVSVATVSGHLHYYRYRAASAFEWWELAELLARWRRVPRRLPGDGSGRPMWLAMRRAVAAGQIDVLSPSLDHGAPIGIRILVHPTAQGPYSLGFAATA